MMPMKVQQIFFNNSLRNFSYLITFDDGAIYCIDPFNAAEIKAELDPNAQLMGIINTHDHHDHYSGNAELLKAYPCPIYAHQNAKIPGMNKGFKDGEVVYQNGPWKLQAVYTPGHTLSHICVLALFNEIPHSVFTGDCLFNAGVGNCHNGGDAEILYKTIHQVFSQYPNELLIYPGHEYLKRNLEFTMNVEPTNVEARNFLNKISNIDLNNNFFINNMSTERKINSFFTLGHDKQVFLKLRELRNKW